MSELALLLIAGGAAGAVVVAFVHAWRSSNGPPPFLQPGKPAPVHFSEHTDGARHTEQALNSPKLESVAAACRKRARRVGLVAKIDWQRLEDGRVELTTRVRVTLRGDGIPRFLLRGTNTAALALLSPFIRIGPGYLLGADDRICLDLLLRRARRVVLGALDVRVTDGSVVHSRVYLGRISRSRVARQFEDAYAVARALQRLGATMPGRLHDLAENAKSSLARIKFARVIEHHYAGHTKSRRALAHILERMCADGDPNARLFAALRLKPGTLERVVCETHPRAVHPELWWTVLPKISRPRALVPWLQRSLEAANAAIVQQALGLLQEQGVDPALEHLTLSLTLNRDVVVVAVVLRAIARRGDPRAEPSLLALLERWRVSQEQPRDELAVEALRALGAVGTAKALPFLALIRDASSSVGLGTSAPTRKAAAAAIVSVRRRVGHVERGSLAVVEAAEAGALGLASDGGELAIASRRDDDPEDVG